MTLISKIYAKLDYIYGVYQDKEIISFVAPPDTRPICVTCSLHKDKVISLEILNISKDDVYKFLLDEGIVEESEPKEDVINTICFCEHCNHCIDIYNVYGCPDQIKLPQDSEKCLTCEDDDDYCIACNSGYCLKCDGILYPLIVFRNIKDGVEVKCTLCEKEIDGLGNSIASFLHTPTSCLVKFDELNDIVMENYIEEDVENGDYVCYCTFCDDCYEKDKFTDQRFCKKCNCTTEALRMLKERYDNHEVVVET